LSAALSNFAVIVSFYQPRPADDLQNLLSALESFQQQTVIVINSDHAGSDPTTHTLAGRQAIVRENIGMNIGAWNEGFLANPGEDYYFFLQDECFIKQPGFFEACIARFSANPKLAMLGESLNHKWNHPWDILSGSGLNWRDADHLINGESVPRVDFYLKTMQSMNIDAGNTGLHLRSLCWAFRGDVLRAMGGFPFGKNKGECIAAEIGVSRKVLQLGFEFDQITPNPFCFIGHREWKADGSSKK
jgi:hypothetical protein